MEDLFRSPDPYAPADPERGAALRVVDALEIGQRRIRAELQDQPELHATLLGFAALVIPTVRERLMRKVGSC